MAPLPLRMQRSHPPTSLGICSHYPLAAPFSWPGVCPYVLPVVLVQPHSFQSHLCTCLQSSGRIWSHTWLLSVGSLHPTTHPHRHLVLIKCPTVVIVSDCPACLLHNRTPLPCEEAILGVIPLKEGSHLSPAPLVVCPLHGKCLVSHSLKTHLMPTFRVLPNLHTRM